MKDVVVTRGLLPFDLVANAVIKLILKKRGAKAIYSDAGRAESELRSISENGRSDYEFSGSLRKCRMKRSAIGGCPLYVIDGHRASSQAKAVIYLHGGGFVYHPDDRHFRMIDDIAAKSGATVYFPVYPKAPEHGYAETYRLVEELYTELEKKYGAGNIVFAGDSAGAMLCVTLCGHFAEKGLPLPKRLILFSLVADTALSNPGIAEIYPRDPMQGTEGLRRFFASWAGDEPVDSPLINPAAVDLAVLPPMNIYCGMNEIFEPDVRKFALRAADAGADVTLVRYRHLYHCFVLFDQLAAYRVRNEAAALIRE